MSSEEEETKLVKFLSDFVEHHRDDNFSTIKYGNYTVYPEEIMGEIADWTAQYLQYM